MAIWWFLGWRAGKSLRRENRLNNGTWDKGTEVAMILGAIILGGFLYIMLKIILWVENESEQPTNSWFD
ncbi:hypothetical protein CMI37_15640 [Candidatus Pacearchaeota archaeon]|nr:hypothetical protein [Candidatus Pacearchaeota archaeon]